MTETTTSPEARGSVVTNVEVVTFALAELDGASRPVHLEEVAERAHSLLPGAFRWDLERFATFIDKDKVRVSLTDAEKDKYGALVRAVGVRRAGLSKKTDAWQLTKAGAAWYVDSSERVAAALGAARPSLKKGRAAELRAQLTASALWKEYSGTGGVSENPFAFADLLECSPDAAAEVIARRFETLLSQIRLLDDPDLVQFLEISAKANADMLR